VFGERPVEDWNYEEDFPKLKRCLALMVSPVNPKHPSIIGIANKRSQYETLRLYSPVVGMVKYTADSPRSLTIQGREYQFPPQCSLSLDLTSLHTDPKSWGSDALTWKPTRFIESIRNEETFVSPSDGSFVPWVSGPRVCPGKKFAQVEFVAVIATVFKNSRVRAESLAGETPEQTKKRVLAIVEDSDVGASPVLKMRHPEKIRLNWERKM
jgi:hypothetical protein